MTIADWSASPTVAPAGQDLGAYRPFPEPVALVPPGDEPVDFEVDVPGMLSFFHAHRA